LSKETELLNAKIEKVSSELVEVTQSKETTTTELQSIQKDNATAKRKQQEIHDKLQSISTQLHEAKSDIEVLYFGGKRYHHYFI
jgi:chromosome segregation ATPase